MPPRTATQPHLPTDHDVELAALDGEHSLQQIDDDNDPSEGSVSDFIRRLYRMLEDQAYPQLLMWSATGDSFIIKDVAEFTTSVLPYAFRHGNYASFVRQLNKYSFRKVKSTDNYDDPFGQQAWIFKHEHFRSGGTTALCLVKRKATPDWRQAPESSIPERTPGTQERLVSIAQSQEGLAATLQQLGSQYMELKQSVATTRTLVDQQNATISQLQGALRDNAATQISNIPVHTRSFQPVASPWSASAPPPPIESSAPLLDDFLDTMFAEEG